MINLQIFSRDSIKSTKKEKIANEVHDVLSISFGIQKKNIH